MSGLGNLSTGATVCIVVEREVQQTGETTIKRYASVFAALAMSLVSSAFVPSLKASETDEKTIITISGPVAVEGTILPAGRYVLKLDSSGSRHVVSSSTVKRHG